MAFKRKASTSLECSLSKRVWCWKSGILGVLVDAFYPRGTPSPSGSQPNNTDAGAIEAVENTDREQPPHADSGELSSGSPHVQGASDSPEIEGLDQTLSLKESSGTNFEPSVAQDDLNGSDGENNDNTDRHGENTLSIRTLDHNLTVSDSSIESRGQLSDHSEPTLSGPSAWNTSRLRARPSSRVLASRSETTLNSFREAYGCQYTLAEFIGLCAYLSGLLRLGYRICTAQMDGFVHMHAAFMREVRDLEEQQRACAEPKLIAYHHWYARLGQDGASSKLIMTEHTLRHIWAENPFTFLKVQRSLDNIVQARRT